MNRRNGLTVVLGQAEAGLEFRRGLHLLKRKHRYLEPMGKMVFVIISAVAELKRSIITERVHAGLHRARKEGKQFGRPKIVVDREKVRTLYAAGSSVRTMAAEPGLRKSTVYNIVAAK